MSRMRIRFLIIALFSLGSLVANAGALKIGLTEQDQRKLADQLSRIDPAFKTVEVIQETPYLVVLKTYKFQEIRHEVKIGINLLIACRSIYELRVLRIGVLRTIGDR